MHVPDPPWIPPTDEMMGEPVEEEPEEEYTVQVKRVDDDWEATAVDGDQLPIGVEITAWSPVSKQDALERLRDGLLDLGIPGKLYVMDL